jgi:hypothetical protein
VTAFNTALVDLTNKYFIVWRKKENNNQQCPKSKVENSKTLKSRCCNSETAMFG